jgi:hypothetical protein
MGLVLISPIHHNTKGLPMDRFQLRRVRHLLAIGSVLLGLLFSLQGAEDAAAIVKGCRGDPKVWLSNGVKVTTAASIAAPPSQVEMVTYILHVPRGVTVQRVVFTGGVLKDKERVVVVPDRASGYRIEARANLGGRVAPVTIFAAVGNDRRSITASSTSTIVFRFP